jgi:SAM-dependent methyltransferase
LTTAVIATIVISLPTSAADTVSTQKIAQIAKNKGLNMIPDFFNKKNSNNLNEFKKNTDVVCAANVICHIPDLNDLIKGIDNVLSKKGVFIFEEPYLGSMLKKVSYDQIYDAHIYIFSLLSVREIFKKYCEHKKFTSIEPMWDSEFTWPHNDVIGYYDSTKLIAWSVITKYNEDDVYSVQFAWDYVDPELRLGMKSIEHECAYYKGLGYRYYYLGEAHKYKENFNGFEILGSV